MEKYYLKRILAYFFESYRFGLPALALLLIIGTLLVLHSLLGFVLLLLFLCGVFLYASEFIKRRDQLIFWLIFVTLFVQGLAVKHQKENAKSISPYLNQTVNLRLKKKRSLFNTEEGSQFVIFETDEGARIAVWLKKEQKNIRELSGQFLIKAAEPQRNPGGFAEDEYLAQYNCYLRGELQMAGSVQMIRDRRLFKFDREILYANFADWLNMRFDPKIVEFILSFCFGQKVYLSKTLNQQFRILGLQHILALSGFHFELFLLPFNAFFKKHKSRTGIRLITLLPLLFLFTYLTAYPIGLIRAASVFLIDQLASIARIEIPKRNILLLILCLWLLISPFSILRFSFQLSFLAGFVIYSAIPYFKNTYLETHLFVQSVVLSLIIQLSMLPLLLFHFNSWQLSAVFLNYFLFIPLLIFFFGGYLFFGFFLLEKTANLHLPDPLFRFPDWLGEHCFELIEKMSDSPVAKFLVKYRQSFLTVGILIFLIFCLTLFVMKRNLYVFGKEKIRLRMSLLFILLLTGVFTLGQRFFRADWRIFFLDVGQGDSCLIISPEQETLLIDSGRTGQGYQVIMPALRELGIDQIDYAVISHFDLDHAGGMIDLLESKMIDRFIIPKIRPAVSPATQDELRRLSEAGHIPVQEVAKGDRFCLRKSELEIELLAPYREDLLKPDNDNQTSLCFILEIEGLTLFFSGDIDFEVEGKMLRDHTLSDVDILKVPHHGSKYGGSEQLLEALKPEHAVISVGVNRYGHPHPDLLQRLKNQQITCHRTDIDGAIMIELKNKKWRISHYK